MERCKNCKHFERSFDYDRPDGLDGELIKTPKAIGFCNKSIEIMYWWGSPDEDKEKELKDSFGGDNVYVHENFGCVNFEGK